LPDGNERDSGIAGWENMGMGFKFQMGMGLVIEMGGNWYEKSVPAHLYYGPADATATHCLLLQ